jgi:hypothetical protein
LSFLLIVRTGRIVTVPLLKRVAPDSNRMFQHIAKFVHGTTIPLTIEIVRDVLFIVTAAIHWGFDS